MSLHRNHATVTQLSADHKTRSGWLVRPAVLLVGCCLITFALSQDANAQPTPGQSAAVQTHEITGAVVKINGRPNRNVSIMITGNDVATQAAALDEFQREPDAAAQLKSDSVPSQLSREKWKSITVRVSGDIGLSNGNSAAAPPLRYPGVYIEVSVSGNNGQSERATGVVSVSTIPLDDNSATPSPAPARRTPYVSFNFLVSFGP